MAEPNPELLDGRTPTIRLAGQDWPIPLLAPKQNRVVVPLVMRRAASLAGLISNGQLSLGKLSELMTTELYDDMLTVTFTALTRGNKIIRAEFDELPIETIELIEAFFTIARQTGLIRPAKPGEQALGEETAATSTGTP